MSSKNKNPNKFKALVIGKRTEPSTEDRALYRLLIVLGITIAAVVLLFVMHSVKVGSMSLMGWAYINIYPWFRWVAVALFAAAIAWRVYVGYFALRDESDSLFSSKAIVGLTAAVAFASWYLYASDNYYPTMVFVIAAGLLGLFAQMTSPVFFRFTLLTSLGAGFWWIAHKGDATLGYIGLFGIAALVVCVWLALLLTEKRYPDDGDVKVPLVPGFLALACICTAVAVIGLVLPAAMPYAVIAFPAVFLAAGIICTVRK